MMAKYDGNLILAKARPGTMVEHDGIRWKQGSDPAGEVEHGAPAEVTVLLDGKKTTVTYQPGDTILETARRGGLEPPFSCEAGHCATCMAVMRVGSATMRANDALTAEEVDEGWVLTCQALPDGPGPATVEYEAF